MSKLLIILLIGIVGVTSLKKPWIGVVSGYMFVLLGPQYIWWYAFQGISGFKLIAIPTMIGFFIELNTGKLKLDHFKSRINFLMMVIWISVIVSYSFGPFINVFSKERPFPPEFVLHLVNTIMIFYFISSALISNPKKIKWLAIPIVISSVYLIYWANMAFLSNSLHGRRMQGPIDLYGNGIYKDENTFAMFFVASLPFLFYTAFYVKRKLVKVIIISLIPFGWHAIFLTASRGGLLGIAATIIMVIMRSKRKIFAIALLPAFILAFQFQGGDLMKSRSKTITLDEDKMESSSKERIEAWETACKMIMDHPITGVGVSSFVAAFPYYTKYDPKEAHNTFFQISAEWGIIAGLCYVFIITTLLKGLWKNGNRLALKKDISFNMALQYYLNEATLVSIFGLTCCAMFLSLHVYEIYYYLILLGNSIIYSSKYETN